MRRLLSPSFLFALWTLLFVLPMLPLVLHRPRVDRAVILREERAAPNGPLASYRQLTNWTRPLAPVIAFVPISYPLFALTFALWPQATGRSLNAGLGRWQFALATMPFLIAPLLTLAVLTFSQAASGAPIVPHGGPPARLSAALFGSMIALFVCWLGSLGLFAINVARTTRGT